MPPERRKRAEYTLGRVSTPQDGQDRIRPEQNLDTVSNRGRDRRPQPRVATGKARGETWRMRIRFTSPGGPLVAAMPDDRCRVHWAARQAVVTLPEHIDSSNADEVREQLLWVINRGAAVLIADLTGTVSCDYSGADALARAYRRAVANGTQLRLVVLADVVRRVLSLNGLDRLAAVYPSLDGAVAAGAEPREVQGEPGTAVIADDMARAEELLDSVVDGIFNVGMILQAAADLPGETAAQRIIEALHRLDDAVQEIRNHVFAEGGQGIQSRLARRPPLPVQERQELAENRTRCCESAWRRRHTHCISPRRIPLRCWSSGLTCSASQGAPTIQPRLSGGRSLLIRQDNWRNAGSSGRDPSGSARAALPVYVAARCLRATIPG